MHFTFHYVSIKTINIHRSCQTDWSLHSTMYLLKTQTRLVVQTKKKFTPLHSTMYLLKPDMWSSRVLEGDTFTFHYVSIKTDFIT